MFRRRGKTLFGAVEAAFVDLGDAVGDLQHRGAPRYQLFVEKRIAELLPLGRRPLESRLQRVPPFVDFRPQRLKRILLFRFEISPVAVERGPRLILDGDNSSVLRLAARRARREKEISHIGTGKVNIRANLFERAKARKECLTDSGFIGAHTVELDESADSRGENE